MAYKNYIKGAVSQFEQATLQLYLLEYFIIVQFEQATLQQYLLEYIIIRVW